MTSCLIVALLLAGCGDAPKEPEQTPLQVLHGQWILVNYWAQWCKPCIEEIPELNEFNHSREDVVVLGVNFEGASGEALAQQEAALGVDFPTIDDPSTELGIPRPAVLPTTLLIDPQGVYRDSLLGPQTAITLSSAIDSANAGDNEKSRP